MKILEAAALVRAPAGTSDAHCCVYQQNLVELAYHLEPAAGDLLARWRIFREEDGGVSAGRAYGPVIAAMAVGAGKAMVDMLPADILPRGYLLCQGWRTTRPDGSIDPARDRGHTFLLKMVTESTAVMIHSSVSEGYQLEWVEIETLRRRYAGGLRAAVLRRPPR